MSKYEIITVSLIAGLVFGFFIGVLARGNRFEKQAIEADVGYYHPKTGEFMFKGVEDE